MAEMPEKRTSEARALIDSIAIMSGINPGHTAQTSFPQPVKPCLCKATLELWINELMLHS